MLQKKFICHSSNGFKQQSIHNYLENDFNLYLLTVSHGLYIENKFNIKKLTQNKIIHIIFINCKAL